MRGSLGIQSDVWRAVAPLNMGFNDVWQPGIQVMSGVPLRQRTRNSKRCLARRFWKNRCPQGRRHEPGWGPAFLDTVQEYL